MTSYSIGQSAQCLVLEESVLNHFRRYQQKRWFSKEAGGQLFAQESQDNKLSIVLATGPRLTDKRTRTAYKPDRIAEQREINTYHTQGLHFIGDWHTHPEYDPRPSQGDLVSITNSFSASRHQLHAFILIVVGLGTLPENLHVGLYDASSGTLLTPNAVP